MIKRLLRVAHEDVERDLLRTIAELAVETIGGDEGSLLVVDGDELAFVMTVGSSESEAALRGQRVPIGEGITGLAAASRDVQIGPPSFEGVEQGAPNEPRQVVAAPMLDGDRLVAVMTVITFHPDKRFHNQHADFLMRLGRVAGAVLRQMSALGAATAEAPEPLLDGDRDRARLSSLVIAAARRHDAGRIADLLESILRLVDGEGVA